MLLTFFLELRSGREHLRFCGPRVGALPRRRIPEQTLPRDRQQDQALLKLSGQIRYGLYTPGLLVFLGALWNTVQCVLLLWIFVLSLCSVFALLQNDGYLYSSIN
jgi:hypothetical protein